MIVQVSRIALRYAQALFLQAKESKSLDKVKKDMELFLSVVEENREFKTLLQAPVVSAEKKRAILSSIFKGKVEKDSLALFDLAASKGRDNELMSVAHGFIKLYNEENNIVKAKLTTSIKLTDKTKKQFLDLASEIAGKKIDLTEEVDPELIGGYILRFEDRQIDSSVKTRLNKIKQQFSIN
ncbi:MAG: ATP synthase F1 subunit delta [Cyclobacteriaceae bacterium]